MSNPTEAQSETLFKTDAVSGISWEPGIKGPEHARIAYKGQDLGTIEELAALKSELTQARTTRQKDAEEIARLTKERDEAKTEGITKNAQTILLWLERHATEIRKRPSGKWQMLNYDGALGEGDSIQGAALNGIEEQVAEGRPHGSSPNTGPCECEECEEFDRLVLLLESTKDQDL